MTTVTLVTGNEGSGRSLVGEAIASHIRTSQAKSAFALSATSKLKPRHFGNIHDLILVSRSNGIEEWMKPWIEEFGEPLFTIHITRHRK